MLHVTNVTWSPIKRSSLTMLSFWEFLLLVLFHPLHADCFTCFFMSSRCKFCNNTDSRKDVYLQSVETLELHTGELLKPTGCTSVDLNNCILMYMYFVFFCQSVTTLNMLIQCCKITKHENVLFVQFHSEWLHLQPPESYFCCICWFVSKDTVSLGLKNYSVPQGLFTNSQIFNNNPHW